MAVTKQHIDAPPEMVFAALMDPLNYPRWVVASKRIRKVDAAWPSPDTAFHHSIGAGPFTIDDSTTIRSIDPPRHLELHVRTRPVLTASVTFTLEPDEDGGTLLTMNEVIEGGWLAPIRTALEPIMAIRNMESLRRLRNVAEEQAKNAA